MVFRAIGMRHIQCLAAAVVSLLASCSVDKEYSLIDKDVDMTVNVGKGVEMPVGDFKMVSIETMLSSSVKNYFKDQGDGFVVVLPSTLPLPTQFGTYEVKGIGDADTKDLRVDNIEFSMDILNTIPFRFSCTAEAIDADANLCPDVKVEMQASIAGGDIQNPSSTPVLMTLALKDGEISFDGFRIRFFITEIPAPGTVVSKEQGVQIINSRLRFPDGITVLDK